MITTAFFIAKMNLLVGNVMLMALKVFGVLQKEGLLNSMD
jgi:hypothetical protein